MNNRKKNKYHSEKKAKELAERVLRKIKTEETINKREYLMFKNYYSLEEINKFVKLTDQQIREIAVLAQVVDAVIKGYLTRDEWMRFEKARKEYFSNVYKIQYGENSMKIVMPILKSYGKEKINKTKRGKHKKNRDE